MIGTLDKSSEMKTVENVLRIYTSDLLASGVIPPSYVSYYDPKHTVENFISSLPIDNSIVFDDLSIWEKANLHSRYEESVCEITDDYSDTSEVRCSYKVLFSFEVDLTNLKPYNPPIYIEDFVLEDAENYDE